MDRSSVLDQDRIEITPLWSIEYRECSRCGATTIVTTHAWTGGRIEVDPLPHRDGYVSVDYQTGRSKVIPIKHLKNYPELWLPHVATCPALKEVANGKLHLGS